MTLKRIKWVKQQQTHRWILHLVVEVTGFSQTVNTEKALPHSTSQAWRNTNPDESLNLERHSGVSSNNCDMLNIFWSLYKSHLVFADEAGSIPVAEQLTQLLHSDWAQMWVADRKKTQYRGMFQLIHTCVCVCILSHTQREKEFQLEL